MMMVVMMKFRRDFSFVVVRSKFFSSLLGGLRKCRSKYTRRHDKRETWRRSTKQTRQQAIIRKICNEISYIFLFFYSQSPIQSKYLYLFMYTDSVFLKHQIVILSKTIMLMSSLFVLQSDMRIIHQLLWVPRNNSPDVNLPPSTI